MKILIDTYLKQKKSEKLLSAIIGRKATINISVENNTNLIKRNKSYRMGEIIPHSSRKSSRTFSQSPLPKANALVRISKRPASLYNGLSSTAKWLPPREYENRPSSPPSSLSLSLPGCASLELSSRGPGRSASKVEVDDSIIEGRARALSSLASARAP